MNAQKKVDKNKEKQVNKLGKCPNCGQSLYEDSYEAIPFKEAENTLFGLFQESLIICKDCSSNPEILLPDKIGETLRESKVKWREVEIDLVVKAVNNYKNLLLNFKNQNKGQFEQSKN